MSQIRSSGSLIERRLYAIVRATLGKRTRIVRNAPLLGRPDLFVPSLRLVIFADGCFYHCCPQHGRVPKSNREYWEPKLARNVSRDNARRRKLRQGGLAVWRIWEHSLEGRALARTSVHLRARLTSRKALLADRSKRSSG